MNFNNLFKLVIFFLIYSLSLFCVFFITYNFFYLTILQDNVFSNLFWSFVKSMLSYLKSYGLDSYFENSSSSSDNVFLEFLVLEIQSSDLFKGYEFWNPTLFWFQKDLVGLLFFIVFSFIIFYLIFIIILGNNSLFTYLEISIFRYYFSLFFIYFFLNAFFLQLFDFFFSPFVFGFSILKGNFIYNIDILGDGFDLNLGENGVKKCTWSDFFWFFFHISVFTFPIFLKIVYFFSSKHSFLLFGGTVFNLTILSFLMVFLLSWLEFDFPISNYDILCFLLLVFFFNFFRFFRLIFTYYWYAFLYFFLELFF